MKKAAANAGWLTATRLVADALSFLLFVAISRSFGPIGTGEYSFGFAIASLVSIGGTPGLDDFGIREYSRLDERARRPLLAALLGTHVLLIGTALLALVVYLFVTHPGLETTLIILLLCAHLLASALARTLFIPAFAAQAMMLPAVAELACRAGAILTALLLVADFDAGLVVALVAFPVFSIALVAIAAVLAIRHGGLLSLHSSWAEVAQTARVVSPFVASELVSQVFNRVDLILLSLIVGQAAAGIYASGFKFVEVGIMPLAFIGIAAYPRLSHLFEADPRAFEALALDLLRVILLLGGFLAWALCFLVPTVIVPVFGTRFIEAVPLMQFMAGLALVCAAEIALDRAMLAAHLQVARFRVLVLGTALSIALNLFLIPLFEIRGAIMAWIITLVIINLCYATALRRCLGGRALGAVFGSYVASLVLALGAGRLAAELELPKWASVMASLATFLVAAVATRLLPPIAPLAKSLPALPRWGGRKQI